MRMQIYEHIYDLSPPIFTHKTLNYLYFFAQLKKAGENLFKRFENLIHFPHTSPWVRFPLSGWLPLWGYGW